MFTLALSRFDLGGIELHEKPKELRARTSDEEVKYLCSGEHGLRALDLVPLTFTPHNHPLPNSLTLDDTLPNINALVASNKSFLQHHASLQG